jgi:hypothetical protein
MITYVQAYTDLFSSNYCGYWLRGEGAQLANHVGCHSGGAHGTSEVRDGAGHLATFNADKERLL